LKLPRSPSLFRPHHTITVFSSTFGILRYNLLAFYNLLRLFSIASLSLNLDICPYNFSALLRLLRLWNNTLIFFCFSDCWFVSAAFLNGPCLQSTAARLFMAFSIGFSYLLLVSVLLRLDIFGNVLRDFRSFFLMWFIYPWLVSWCWDSR
jgi:hypothetical protein